MSFTPDGSRAYVATGNGVVAINTATNAVVATVPLSGATAYGQFIRPAAAAPAAVAVPTLSEWAMVLLGLLLAGGSMALIQRRTLWDAA